MPNQKEVKEAMEKYRKRFKEGFPSYYFTANDEIEKMMEEINKAIKTGKPYEPDVETEKDGKPIAY